MALLLKQTWLWRLGTNHGTVVSMTLRDPPRLLSVDALESSIWEQSMINWPGKSFQPSMKWENGGLSQKRSIMKIRILLLIALFIHLLEKIHGQGRKNSAGVKLSLKMSPINVQMMAATANAKVTSSTWQKIAETRPWTTSTPIKLTGRWTQWILLAILPAPPHPSRVPILSQVRTSSASAMTIRPTPPRKQSAGWKPTGETSNLRSKLEKQSSRLMLRPMPRSWSL